MEQYRTDVQSLISFFERLEFQPVENPLVKQAVEECQSRHVEFLQDVRGMSLVGYYRDRGLRGDAQLESGDKIVARIRKMLDEIKPSPKYDEGRSDIQIQMHEKMLRSAIPHIYQREWIVNPDAVLKRNGLTSVRRHMIFACPRRFGKTTAIQMMLLSLLVNLPFRTEIVVFSNGEAASLMMLTGVQRLAHMHDVNVAKYLKRVNDNGRVVLYYIPPGKTQFTANCVTALPGAGDGLRGNGGDIVIAEEMAFMKPYTLEAGLAPILQKKDAVLWAISSQEMKQDNFFNALMSEKDTKGEPLFDVTRITYVCDKCAQEKFLTECDHVKVERPHYLDDSSLQVIKALMKNNPALFNAEILGITSDINVRVFPPTTLSEFMMSPKIEPVECPKFMHMYIDPSGGGKNRSAAVTVSFMSDGTLLVSGDLECEFFLDFHRFG